MKIQIDPRTGKIVEKIKREISLPVQSKQSTPSVELDLSFLMEIAKKMGETIAAEILRAGFSPQKVQEVSQATVQDLSVIAIDESVIDVGLEETEEFKKGSKSAELFKKATESDNISSAKERLKKLKKDL